MAGDPIANVVHIFKQQGGDANKGLWEESEETLSPPDDDVLSPYFGGSVGVNGNAYWQCLERLIVCILLRGRKRRKLAAEGKD